MKKIELFEKAINENKGSLKDYGINKTLFWAYRYSLEAGNELIDFSDVIWDNEIEEIAVFLKENGITEFTVSSNFSGLIGTLAAFDKNGFKISGMTQVIGNHRDFTTGQPVILPAIILTLQE